MIKKYKSVCLYNAETKKTTSRSLKIANFKSEKELRTKIEDLKSEQREKNRIFKNNKKRQDIDIIKNNLSGIESTIIQNTKKELITKSISEIIKDIKIKNKVNLKLDKDTGNSLVIIGSSKRGKSTTMMHVFDRFFNKKKFISTLFSKNIHIKIFKGRKLLLKCGTFNHQSEKYIKLEKFINSKCKNKYNFLNMFDDILNLRQNRLLNNLIMTYRNSNLSTIINIQDPVLLDRKQRQNINNIFFFGLNTEDTIDFVIDKFLKSHFIKLGLKSMDEKILFYKLITRDHGFIYLHPETDKITFHKLKL